MILYFSGTGNSEYVAKRISSIIDDEAVSLFERLRDHDFSEINSERPWIIAAPTYAWRIPRILQSWLEKTRLSGNRNIYFVMTCGGNLSNAGKYLEKLCSAKSLNYMGCMEIIMPENYIALFSTPSREKAGEIIGQAEETIDKAASIIKKGGTFPQHSLTLMDKLNSGIINNIFYPMFVHAKKFYATDTCISCGICTNVCPTANIRLENGKPVWSKNCTHCMACINRCPKEAIEYGKHSIGLPRYTFPE